MKLPSQQHRELLPFFKKTSPLRRGLRTSVAALLMAASVHGVATETTYTLQVLHYYGESGLLGIQTAPVMGAMIDKMDGDYTNTVVLAHGDSFIPGPWLYAGADSSLNSISAIGSTALGRPDIAIMNAFGTTASALGNHEFDLGSPVLAGAVFPSGVWAGAQFPFITANLDFASDSILRARVDVTLGGTGGAIAGLEVADIKAKIAPYAIKTIAGEKVGFVGATNWELLTKSSPNGTIPKDDANSATSDLEEVAAYLQGAVNALTAQGVNKIILVDQLDTLQRNKDLAGLVSGIDIMVAGGGHERMGDSTDTPAAFNGHDADFIADAYPISTTGADGKPVLIVTTDTEYTYLGRLVVEFDAAGEIIPSSLNLAVNGAYPATEAKLQEVYATTDSAAQIIAGSAIGSQVKSITDALNTVVVAKDGNVFGYTNVYLEGDRVFGRTEEVNLGDITADANAFKAKQALGLGPASAVFSLKNGGGLRSSVGSVLADGTKVAPIANPITAKPAGGISQLDVENALRFDNKLMVCEMTPAGLLGILNFAAGLSSGPTAQNGGYAQVGNIRYSYDSSRPSGQRVRTVSLVNDAGQIVSRVVENGVVRTDAPTTVQAVVLNFTMNGGDSYPIKYLNPPTNTTANNAVRNFRYILANGTLSAPVDRSLDFTAAATFTSLGLTAADILGEQQAFQEYLATKHPAPASAFASADTPAALDVRIQQLARNGNVDTVNTGDTYISTVAIGNASVTEGNSGTVTVNLPVTHTANANANSAAFSVNYAVTGGTATAGTDFATLAAGTLTFAPGGGTQNITITVQGDTAVESSETVIVTLSNVANSAGTTTLIGTGTGTATIRNDDTIPVTYPSTNAFTSSVAGGIALAGAEIPAFDPLSKRAFASSNTGVQVVDLTDPANPAFITTIQPATLGIPAIASNDVTSVAIRKGDGTNPSVLAVAILPSPKTDPGYVVFLNAADGTLLGHAQVGANPDNLTFSPDGTKVLVANEGEVDGGTLGNADLAADTTLGTVSIIDVSAGFSTPPVATADFTAFDSQVAALRAAGVRIFNNGSIDATPSRDFEPEYIAISPDGTKAMVTLQEANAVAVLDIATATFTSVAPLGKKNFAPLRMDFSDRDGPGAAQLFNPTTGNPVFGLYMPDAIASYTANGQTYYVTANEGDDRNDFINPDESTTVGAATGYVLDPTVFPNAAALKNQASLGRLTVSNSPGLRGDTDNDGDVDEILSYGGRSFSILDANGAQVFDSGDILDLIVMSQGFATFDDGRSDNKGVEPEGVTIATLSGRTYAFIGLERAHMVLMFDVTNPTAPTFTTSFAKTGDLNPEGLIVVQASDSPNGKPLLITTNEVSNTLSVFEINDTTAPALTVPSDIIAEATAPTGAAVNFSFTATDGGSGIASSSATPASGSTFPLGTTTVNVSAADVAGNSAAGSFNVTVRDTTAPTVGGTFSPLSFLSSDVVPDFTSQLVATDAVGVASITQSPAAGTTAAPGVLSVTLTASDAAGNSQSTSFNVNVIPVDPSTSIVAGRGSAVPGAGTDPRIQAGAKWTTFGTPSINDAGQIAFVGNWSAPAITGASPVPAQTSAGIFLGDALLVRKGDAAPGIMNAVMSSFTTPVLTPGGAIAWIATLANAPLTSGAVTTANDKALFVDTDGAGPTPAMLVARKGSEAAGAAAAATLPAGVDPVPVWSTFSSVALGDDALAFTATLASRTPGRPGLPGPGGVTALTDSGLWVYDRATSSLALAIRKGDTALTSRIRGIGSLVARAGSPGQGRGVAADGSIAARITLTDNRHAIATIIPDATSTYHYVSNAPATGFGTGAKWATLGFPTQSGETSSLAFLGSALPSTGTATSSNNDAIFVEDDTTAALTKIAAESDSAPGVTGGLFGTFKDPVNAAGSRVTFAAALKLDSTLGIANTNNDGLWHYDPETGLTLLAREGAQPPEGPAGAQWKSFPSIAAPEGDRGPLFIATMQSRTGTASPGPGGVTEANDTGLWALDTFGALRLVLREGDTIGTRTVRSFEVLSNVLGSPGHTRSVNRGGSVVVRTFDGSGAQYILRIEVP
jgi:2',3'-cyclic-nucleotide 2'-phosphodiesterase (5'-nucleotidase family)